MLQVPMLMLHGDCDRISSHEATTKYWNELQHGSKRLMIIDGDLS